ncbi:hypothetical protein RJ639_028218 [Escallonia herrerae]|uniref:Uncharacterized protein n=1 Tax=Escallonia herrerae TaxID=1293975 RepID=A0AA89BGN8_9ASTE|nr:hypothetical protein RJ639_028218 [Escallonia herrerae]
MKVEHYLALAFVRTLLTTKMPRRRRSTGGRLPPHSRVLKLFKPHNFPKSENIYVSYTLKHRAQLYMMEINIAKDKSFDLKKRSLYTANLDHFEHFQGSNALNQPNKGASTTQDCNAWKPMGCEEKQAVVHEEMRRMNNLPANSTYATHRLRVLNKILQLLAIQMRRCMDTSLHSDSLPPSPGEHK